MSDPWVVAKGTEPFRRELAPGRADGVKDRVVIFMDPVRQMPLAQVKPDPFHGIQFRRVGWQPEQRQIGWDNEIQAGMPPGAVKHHHGDFRSLATHGLEKWFSFVTPPRWRGVMIKQK